MLNQWANRFGVSAEALEELRRMTGVSFHESTNSGQSETYSQQEIRLEGSRRGEYLWRNNVGALPSDSGRIIRFGLCNDSKNINKVIKSSDLIGVTPYTVKPTDVGGNIGIFTSYEVKKPGWVYKGTSKEKAQLAWVNLIISLGGISKFATGPGDIWHD